MADISKGPKQDTDWFSSNGTLAQVGSAIGSMQGLHSMSAIDRVVSLAKVLPAIVNGFDFLYEKGKSGYDSLKSLITKGGVK